MNTQQPRVGLWNRLPLMLRAIVIGLLIGMIAANVWLPLLLVFPTLLSAVIEIVFLTIYLWWVSGHGPPTRWQATRAEAFRAVSLTGKQWFWGVVAAVSFAVTVHAAIVVLFRLTPFPAEDFHKGYNLSFIHSLPLQWLAVVGSAASAGFCEETGFRGYMQRPLESRYGVVTAIFISSLFFMLVHMSKGWATVGMVPIVFGAGVLLGMLAVASRSLLPGMIGHTVMDIGLFGYWWTGIAGTFPQRPIAESGLDWSFVFECSLFIIMIALTLAAIARLRRWTNAAHTAA